MNLIPLWNRMSRFPGGKWLFGKIVGKKVPYSGTIGARIEVLEPGHARISMRDRRCVRNHLRSVHAVALMNLAELTSGICLVAGLPPYLRAILVGFKIEYLKKSRGTITADAVCQIPTAKENKEMKLAVELKNSDGNTVCRAEASWLISPVT